MTSKDFLFPRIPNFIGFEDLFNAIERNTAMAANTYPPYNIKKTDDDTWEIELAVAGFSEGELSMEIAGGKLTISGDKEADKTTYLYKGIGARNFRQVFQLADSAQIAGANLVNGILSVVINKVIPDHLKPRQIPINKPAGKKPELLTE